MKIPTFFCVNFLYLSIQIAGAQPGHLNQSFGSFGKVIHDAGFPDERINAVAIQSDDKIVCSGYSWDQVNTCFIVSRFLPDGRPDLTFGATGTVLISFNGNDEANSVAVRPDGKIMVAGFTWDPNGNLDFAAVRLNSDGSPDHSFGDSGKLVFDFSHYDYHKSMILQPDGKIVLSGNTQIGTQTDFLIVRFHENGSLDVSFGTDGVVVTDLSGGNDFVGQLLLQEDGKLVVIGSGANPASGYSFAFSRYNDNGSLDSYFGTGGITLDNSPVGLHNILLTGAVLRDGKIIAGGWLVNDPQRYAPDFYDFAMVRIDKNGAIDHSFGESGKVITDIGSGDICTSLLQLQDGTILAGGYSTSEFSRDFVLVNFSEDGILNESFGDQGIVITDLEGGSDMLRAMAVQSDGTLIATGHRNTAEGSDFALAAYQTRIALGYSEWASKWSIFPNPAVDRTNIEISLNRDQVVSITLLDQTGRIFFTTEKHLSTGYNQVELEYSSDLPDQVYNLIIQSNDGRVAERLIKRSRY